MAKHCFLGQLENGDHFESYYYRAYSKEENQGLKFEQQGDYWRISFEIRDSSGSKTVHYDTSSNPSEAIKSFLKSKYVYAAGVCENGILILSTLRTIDPADRFNRADFFGYSPVYAQKFAQGFEFSLAGTIKNQDTIYELFIDPETEVELKRIPDSPFDTNCIAVYSDGMLLGNVPSYLAATLAPLMDKGAKATALFMHLNTCEGHATQGITIKVTTYGA